MLDVWADYSQMTVFFRFHDSRAIVLPRLLDS